MNIPRQYEHSLAVVQFIFCVAHLAHKAAAQAKHYLIVAVRVLLKVQIFVHLIIKILAFYASVPFVNNHKSITVQIYFFYYKTYFCYYQDISCIMDME